jgi:hypothetical protein
MEDFVETTLSAKGLEIVSPKRSYGFGTPQGSVCAYDVGSASVVQSEAETVCDILEVTGTIASSKTVQMYLDVSSLKGNKLYKVSMSVASSSGGPFTVTFSTGLAGKQSVVVPVIASTSTLTSPKYMLFGLYVDAQGNVSSSEWEVSASNSDGNYTMSYDGTMKQWGWHYGRGDGSGGFALPSKSYPSAFVGQVPVCSGNYIGAKTVASGAPTSPLSATSVFSASLIGVAFYPYSAADALTTLVINVEATFALANTYNFLVFWNAIGRWL